MTAFMGAVKATIIQILQTVTSHVALNKEPYIPDFIPEIISGAISVADPIVSFFLGFYAKKRSFQIPDLMNPANNLKDKI